MTDLLLETVRTFATRELYPVAGEIDRSDKVPSRLVDAMHSLGIVGLAADDADLEDVLRVVETLSAGSPALAMLVVAPEATVGAGRERTGLRGLRSGVSAGCGTATDRRRLMLAAGAAAIGAAARALEETRRYLEQREAFGQVLVDVPVLAATLRDRQVELQMARTALRDCARESDLRGACAAARVATRTAVTATYDAIQLHGGYGYMTEYQIERIARDCISLRALVAELDVRTDVRDG